MEVGDQTVFDFKSSGDGIHFESCGFRWRWICHGNGLALRLPTMSPTLAQKLSRDLLGFPTSYLQGSARLVLKNWLHLRSLSCGGAW